MSDKAFSIHMPVTDRRDLPATVTLHERWRVFFPLRLQPDWVGLSGGPKHDEETFFDASSEAEVREKIATRSHWLTWDDVLRIEFWYELTGRTRTELRTLEP